MLMVYYNLLNGIFYLFFGGLTIAIGIYLTVVKGVGLDDFWMACLVGFIISLGFIILLLGLIFIIFAIDEYKEVDVGNTNKVRH